MLDFNDLFEDKTKYGTKLKTDQYQENGKNIIVDQGQNDIAGYTNMEKGLFTDVPAIIFGDHTRVVKYIDQPFFLGADGTKILKSKYQDANYKYLYYALKYIKIPNTGYNRHYKWLKELKFKYPAKEEQKQIVFILDKIGYLIQKNNSQLELLDELIKARFVEMFGEPILNDKGWETKRLLELGKFKNGMNFRIGESGVNMHCLGVGDFKDRLEISDMSMLPKISLNKIPPEEVMLKNGDIVFVRSNGNKMLVGRCLVIYPGDIPTTYSGFCIRFRKEGRCVDTTYLIHLLKANSIRSKITGRGANIQNLNQQILGAVKIPIPPIELQLEFKKFIKQVDKSR
ncbi:restriction endonuclease subunit S [Thomasclavelia sp.]|uniref:restriction endonuclease subunit S n=1 Tax=Thomasclavelia sp. TaxID=3025757 RepID=UPI0025E279E6|nr:restriction endonuclease subunit S [Thomasclavelia sp.]